MYNTDMNENQIKQKKHASKNMFDTAKMVSEKSDELWIKFLKWFWIIAIIYIIYIGIQYVFSKIGL